MPSCSNRRRSHHPGHRPLLSLAICVGLLAATWGCDDGARTLEGETVTVGCGRCMFHMPQAQGCPIAAQVDGKHYLIQGRVPEGHQNHAPDGICNMTRQAVVDGTVRNGKLITSRVELKPATDIPAQPRFSEQDIHE